jgi:hypothetical protein
MRADPSESESKPTTAPRSHPLSLARMIAPRKTADQNKRNKYRAHKWNLSFGRFCSFAGSGEI